MRFNSVVLALLCTLSACSHLPGGSEFVCNDAAKDRAVINDVDTRGEALAALLNALASLGANPDFREESAAALNRCDREFLIWYVQMSADHPEKLTEYDRMRFNRLTNDT
jgi:hypothetical protein